MLRSWPLLGTLASTAALQHRSRDCVVCSARCHTLFHFIQTQLQTSQGLDQLDAVMPDCAQDWNTDACFIVTALRCLERCLDKYNSVLQRALHSTRDHPPAAQEAVGAPKIHTAVVALEFVL
jgi:hypothetical protein